MCALRTHASLHTSSMNEQHDITELTNIILNLTLLSDRLDSPLW